MEESIQELMASGWHEFACGADSSAGGAKNGEHSYVNSNAENANSSSWRSLPLDGVEAVLGSSVQAPGSSLKAKRLAELGVSPLWIEHIINGTAPKLDAHERQQIIDDAVGATVQLITDQLIYSYRPIDGF
jgi:hypothetical protein